MSESGWFEVEDVAPSISSEPNWSDSWLGPAVHSAPSEVEAASTTQCVRENRPEYV